MQFKALAFLSILSILFFTGCDSKDKSDDNSTEKTQKVERKSEFQLKTSSGASVNVKLDNEKIIVQEHSGKIVLLNFFATWCPPCMREIPHFVEKMKELKGKPVKFTFVSVDAKEDWNTKVSDFADEYDLRKNVVLFDASMISPDYFTKITKTWDGGSIPFTVIKKGDKEVENVGMMSKEDLDAKLNSFK